MFQLTKGSLKKILDGQACIDPLLQIMQMKNIQNNMDGVTRYKLSLFDGESSHTFGILATQKNSLVESNELKIGSVIKLTEFASNVLSKDPPKVVVILLNFEVLGEMDTKPQQSSNAISATANESPQKERNEKVQNENIEPNHNELTKTTVSKSFYSNQNKDTPPKIKPAGKLTSPNNSTLSSTASASSNSQKENFNGFKVFGISSLNPYQNKWSIKVRVTNKPNIRHYTNAKGEGRLFSVDLMDKTGEIRATGFNDSVDKFYELLQVDNVYYISRATLKTANKQYSKLENDYEMTFNNDTVIEQCHELDDLPQIVLKVVPFSELINKNPQDIVDVIGVVKSASEVATIITKATNRELRKRELNLVDSTCNSITCTIWGKLAEDFDASDNPVILIKGAKLGDYGGRSLSVLGSSTVQLNPDVPEAHSLRGWFDQGGATDNPINDLTTVGGASQIAGSTSANISANIKTLDVLKDEKLGMGDKADYLTAKAIVLYAKKDNSMYMACPEKDCNKKVVDQNDGTYRCEKCAKNYPNFKWRMILSVNLADYTDSNWATLFQESAETILGINADDLGALKNSDPTKHDEYFANCVFKEYNFKLRAKMETYNDEKRVKVTVVSAEDIDYVASGKRILENLKKFAKNNI